MAGVLFGDFGGMTKTERKKDFWRRVLVDVTAWAVSCGIIVTLLSLVSIIVLYLLETEGLPGLADEVSGIDANLASAIISVVIVTITSGLIAVLAGIVIGFFSGIVDAWLGGLIGISAGRGVGFGVVAAIKGILYGILVVLVIGFIFAISGGTGSDILESLGINVSGDHTWAVIVAAVVIVLVICVTFTLLGFLMGAITGAMAGVGNIFLKGKKRVFSEIPPAVLLFTTTGLLTGIGAASSDGSVLAIIIGIVIGLLSGALFGLMLGLSRYVIPDRFINRPNGKGSEITG